MVTPTLACNLFTIASWYIIGHKWHGAICLGISVYTLITADCDNQGTNLMHKVWAMFEITETKPKPIINVTNDT